MKKFFISVIILTIPIFIVYMFLVGWCTMAGFTGGVPNYPFFCPIDLIYGPGSGFNGPHEIFLYFIISFIISILIVSLPKIFKK